ncbi:MAG: 3-isopropylmalate dehydratase small subunit [Ardenticatenia bacterium]|nr:MAG: 3-isopropylmalate dehydratase small subunit [Ardenticatenia bacterium]
MSTTIRGRVHVYRRDHINTDEIIPARYLTSDDPEYLGLHAMEDLDPEFPKKVQPGDIVIAGKNFGTGSSREHAVWALRAAGVALVIADNYANIFYRNAINNGFLALEVPGAADAFETGDEAVVDLRAGTLTNTRTGQTLTFAPLPDFALKVREAGGYLEYLKARESTVS